MRMWTEVTVTLKYTSILNILVVLIDTTAYIEVYKVIKHSFCFILGHCDERVVKHLLYLLKMYNQKWKTKIHLLYTLRQKLSTTLYFYRYIFLHQYC